MNASPFDYPAAEYYVLPHKLYELGRFADGDAALRQIEGDRPATFSTEIRYQEQLNRAITDSRVCYNSDLIEYADDWIKCDTCAIFKGRVYSVYGNDKRFPVLPENLRAGACKVCGGQFIPCNLEWKSHIYVYSKTGETVKVNAEKHSNRPYKDNRSAADKQRFEEYLKRRKVRDESQKIRDFRAFCLLKNTDPENCPKSFSAYMRKINKEK